MRGQMRGLHAHVVVKSMAPPGRGVSIQLKLVGEIGGNAVRKALTKLELPGCWTNTTLNIHSTQADTDQWASQLPRLVPAVRALSREQFNGRSQEASQCLSTFLAVGRPGCRGTSLPFPTISYSPYNYIST